MQSIWSGMIGGQTDADLDPGVGDIQDQQGERVMLIYYLKRGMFASQTLGSHFAFITVGPKSHSPTLFQISIDFVKGDVDVQITKFTSLVPIDLKFGASLIILNVCAYIC